MPRLLEPALFKRATEVMFRLGAVDHPIVAKDFLLKHGEKIISLSGDEQTRVLWDCIDEYLGAHPEKFKKPPQAPDLMERDSKGNFVHDDPDRVMVAHAKDALNAEREEVRPGPDLMAKNPDGSFVVKAADDAVDSLIWNLRRMQ